VELHIKTPEFIEEKILRIFHSLTKTSHFGCVELGVLEQVESKLKVSFKGIFWCA